MCIAGASEFVTGSAHRYATRVCCFAAAAGGFPVHKSIPARTVGSGCANAARNSARGNISVCNSLNRTVPPATIPNCGPMKNVATDAATPVDCAVMDVCASGSLENAGLTACKSTSVCWSGVSLLLTAGMDTPYCEENSASDACKLPVPGADC